LQVELIGSGGCLGQSGKSGKYSWLTEGERLARRNFSFRFAFTCSMAWLFSEAHGNEVVDFWRDFSLGLNFRHWNRGSAGFRRESLELFLQGVLLSDSGTCKADFSTARAFRSCSPVQKVGNVAY